MPMNDETSLVPYIPLEQVAAIAEQSRARNALDRYHEGLSDETLERQRYDLELLNQFLLSVQTRERDFYNDLEAWQHINAGLVDGFLQWMKHKGYAIGSLNVRLATVKAYCKIAHDAGIIQTSVYTRIQGVKGIPRKSARNVDKRREVTRVSTKKASAVDLPDMAIYALKHPDTGLLAKRDTLLMCLLLDHGLRVGEVAILKKTQINLTNKLLTFDRPKVTKDAELHLLTDDTYAAALEYLPTIPDEQESLFDLAVTSIQERVRMLGRAVGIPNLSPHDCRHSYADRAARNGATLDALMQAGGWSNYQTPLGYLKRRTISNDGITL
jgi:integrase